MPTGCRVDTVHPINIGNLGELPLIVKNVGAVTIYYKQGAAGSSVTPTSKDGEIEAGKEFTVTQATWVIAKEPGAQLDFIRTSGQSAFEEGLSQRVGRRVSVDAYEGSVNASPATNIRAINAAIKAAGNGGTVIFPDYCASKPTTGRVYEYEGEIEASGYEFLTLEGLGGNGGGGGFASSKAYTAATSLQCVSKTAGQKQCINATSTHGFRMRGLYHYNASKQVAETSGSTQLLLFGSKMPSLWDVGLEATGVGEIYPINGMIVLTAEGGQYDFCRFTGNKNHVVGVTIEKSQAVGHTLNSCWFLGHLECAVKNPGLNWALNDCIWEEKYNTAGEVAQGSASVKAEFPVSGLKLSGGWMGGAKEVGTHILLAEGGSNLQITGTSMQNAEKLIEFAGKPVTGFNIQVACSIAKKGLVVASGSKGSYGTYIPVREWYEGAELAAVATLLEGEANLNMGSALQAAPSASAWPTLAVPAGETSGELKAALKTLIEVAKAQGTVK